jgi:hypothetical protein
MNVRYERARHERWQIGLVCRDPQATLDDKRLAKCQSPISNLHFSLYSKLSLLHVLQRALISCRQFARAGIEVYVLSRLRNFQNLTESLGSASNGCWFGGISCSTALCCEPSPLVASAALLVLNRNAMHFSTRAFRYVPGLPVFDIPRDIDPFHFGVESLFAPARFLLQVIRHIHFLCPTLVFGFGRAIAVIC